MAPDDFDDLLDDGKAELEQRFRELEQQEEIARMRGGGAPETPSEGDSSDDLSDLKSALDDDSPPPPDAHKPSGGRYVLLVCPHCEAKNRTDLERVRTRLPVCGACKKPLSFDQL